MNNTMHTNNNYNKSNIHLIQERRNSYERYDDIMKNRIVQSMNNTYNQYSRQQHVQQQQRQKQKLRQSNNFKHRSIKEKAITLAKTLRSKQLRHEQPRKAIEESLQEQQRHHAVKSFSTMEPLQHQRQLQHQQQQHHERQRSRSSSPISSSRQHHQKEQQRQRRRSIPQSIPKLSSHRHRQKQQQQQQQNKRRSRSRSPRRTSLLQKQQRVSRSESPIMSSSQRRYHHNHYHHHHRQQQHHVPPKQPRHSKTSLQEDQHQHDVQRQIRSKTQQGNKHYDPKLLRSNNFKSRQILKNAYKLQEKLHQQQQQRHHRYRKQISFDNVVDVRKYNPADEPMFYRSYGKTTLDEDDDDNIPKLTN